LRLANESDLLELIIGDDDENTVEDVGFLIIAIIPRIVTMMENP
jgi:hypothetical protein